MIAADHYKAEEQLLPVLVGTKEGVFAHKPRSLSRGSPQTGVLEAAHESGYYLPQNKQLTRTFARGKKKEEDDKFNRLGNRTEPLAP